MDVCELSGYPLYKIAKDKLYKNALDMYAKKVELEQHFSKKTNELFDIQYKTTLFYLTNTYFEGWKDKSEIAKFGRSKEKRCQIDCFGDGDQPLRFSILEVFQGVLFPII